MSEEDLDIANQKTEEMDAEDRRKTETVDPDETEEISFERRKMSYSAAMEIERRDSPEPDEEEIAEGLDKTVNLLFPTFSNVPLSNLKRIAKGGYSHVFKGKCINTGEPVALKVAKYPVSSRTSLEDFKRTEKMFVEEAAVHKAVSEHPLNQEEGRIVKFIGSGVFEKAYDTGLDNGHRFRHINYIATEFMEGRSADSLLQYGNSVSLAHKFYVLVRIARALEITHIAGYAHGDVKEGNAVVCGEGLDVKLADWGNAISLEKNEGSVSVLRTSPRYTSPERYKNMALPSVSDDIWAYGVILYQTLEGRHPFSVNPKTPIQCIQDTANNPLLPFRNKEGVNSGLAEVAAKCLEKNPSQRYKSMTDVMYGLANCTLPWVR